uniref:Uncharacterized protein n=1 Tax=Utricularia reniformis TaxID=192314 RepID=A0A1Y0B3R5_9LAMI|nr:hypothetical protein AEK19_MT1894 [Utricularia reniformis]ART32062.1 hypothetical protein AEK19_MT1894 [Utricularia reniformis]
MEFLVRNGPYRLSLDRDWCVGVNRSTSPAFFTSALKFFLCQINLAELDTMLTWPPSTPFFSVKKVMA